MEIYWKCTSLKTVAKDLLISQKQQYFSLFVHANLSHPPYVNNNNLKIETCSDTNSFIFRPQQRRIHNLVKHLRRSSLQK